MRKKVRLVVEDVVPPRKGSKQGAEISTEKPDTIRERKDHGKRGLAVFSTSLSMGKTDPRSNAAEEEKNNGQMCKSMKFKIFGVPARGRLPYRKVCKKHEKV